jgi:hypothetical protein
MSNITIPKKLDPIIQAFFAESPKAAKRLIVQAASAIYGSEEERDPSDVFTRYRPITDEQLEDVCTFMQGIKPADTLEAIIAAQIVVSHMLGMHKLASGLVDDQRLGLKMLHFSGEAMGRLQKKRSGGMQNVTVNYNYNGTRPAIPTIPAEFHGDLETDYSKEAINSN